MSLGPTPLSSRPRLSSRDASDSGHRDAAYALTAFNETAPRNSKYPGHLKHVNNKHTRIQRSGSRRTGGLLKWRTLPESRDSKWGTADAD